MPSDAVSFRTVCGRFLPAFIGFMLKRVKKKKALRIAIVKLARKVDGVAFALLLSYLFWGSLLLRCGDIESNPGPNPPPGKNSMRQTRLSSAGTSRSVDKASDSRTTVSSPSATAPTLTDVMNTLNERSDQMDAKMDALRQDMHKLSEDYAGLKDELKELRREVTELREENEELRKTNNTLTEKLEDCEKRIDDLEGRSKRNNLIFYGLPRRENETPADCEGLLQDLFTSKLNLTDHVELDRAHRLNAKPDSPVIARCAFYKQKVKVLKAKSKLKGSNVFIGEDFSRGVRDLRRRLAPHLKKAREDGKKATMVFNYLLIDGHKFTVDNCDKLIEWK